MFLQVIVPILLFFSAGAYENTALLLTQKTVDEAGSQLVIKKNYTLGGKTITLPENTVLVFKGGKLDNGEIIGNHTKIKMSQNRPAFGTKILIAGNWDVPEVKDSWFDFDESPSFVSNCLINNMLSFSNDASPCHIIFDEKRIYYFELPYKGRSDIGNVVSFRITSNGTKKRDYSEIYNKEYDGLKIFTIPSNTHLTVNNTLKMLPTGVGAYFIFWEYGKENITIDGTGVISGDNDWHRYDQPFTGKTSFGQWGHVFKCFRCSNFTFKDITITDSFGDCIMYSGSFFPDEKEDRWASNLTLENVKIMRARRNGVAIGARNVIIRNCHFEGCGTKEVRGTSPRCAIDFEPDRVSSFPEIGNQDVLMENCTFKDNYFDLSSYLNNLKDYGKIATTIKNCRFSSKIRVQGTYWMRFENCYIPFVYNTKDSRSLMLYSRHMEFDNCEFGEYDTSIVGTASKVFNKYTNCKFNTAPSRSSKK